MTVGNVIQLIELGISGRGLNRPNPEIIRDLLKSKWQEFVGETRAHDGKYDLTTDGNREIELPVGVRIISMVIVDNCVAKKVTAESVDRSYANEQALL